MGFYFRKSIQFGLLRFNLSKSGIGVSAGVKGLRFGTGPHGNYIQMGRDGIYYRKTLPNPRTPRQVSNQPQTPSLPSPIGERFTDHCGPAVEIESGDVSGMTNSSSAQLLTELNTKRKRLRFGPFCVFLFCTSILFLLTEASPTPSLYAGTACLALLVIFAFWTDKRRKTTCLWYDFDPHVESAYASLHNAVSNIASCSKCWHVESSAAVYDRKYHAGASSLLRRNPTNVRIASPSFLKTNVKTVAIEVGRQTLYFFPDRLLVFDRGRVGAVDYGELTLAVSSRRFIEDGTHPGDARVVDHTWRYVNKNGGPDRRFNGNRQLPICLYDELHFSSSSGLNELIQTSRADIASPLVGAIRSLAKFTKAPPGPQQRIFNRPSRFLHPASSVYLVIVLAVGMAIFLKMRPNVETKPAPPIPPLNSTGSAPMANADAPDSGSQNPPPPTVSKSPMMAPAESPLPSKIGDAAHAAQSAPAVPRFETVEDAQKEAVRRYPELGVRGSKLNAAFLARYKTYQQSRPEYFTDPLWPIRLAEELSALNTK